MDSANGKPLTCPTCATTAFERRRRVLDTRTASFFNFTWTNRGKTDFICRRCGHILSFADA